MAVELKFSKASFAHLDLPDLLLNIFDYSHSSCVDCPKCIQYAKWCIELVSERWLDDEYLDFLFVINSILNDNRKFCDFGKIWSADRHKIFDIIKK